MVELRAIEHAGFAAIELIAGRTRMVVVHGVGPRIAWFGARGGENLLYWDHAGRHTHGAWRMYGGHRLWTTRADADESEETYAADNEPCQVRKLADGVAVTATSAVTRLAKTVAIRAGRAGWSIEHRIRNIGDMLWAGGAWALTCTVPTRATHYRVPLPTSEAAWDVLTMVIPRRWGGTHSSRLADPQFELREDALAIRPRGREAKRMVFAPSGTLEMHDAERGIWRKQASVIAGASYPLGCNVAVYLGPARFMVELETMSPIVRLAPGESLRHVERWSLQPAK